MLALKTIAVIIGLAFTLVGYFIFFKKKYSLINGFEEDYKAGRKNEKYAERIRLVEFVVGVVILIAVVILLVFG